MCLGNKETLYSQNNFSAYRSLLEELHYSGYIPLSFLSTDLGTHLSPPHKQQIRVKCEVFLPLTFLWPSVSIVD